MVCFISHFNMYSMFICVRVNSHSPYAQFLGSAHDSACYLTAVGNKHFTNVMPLDIFFEHASMAEPCTVLQIGITTNFINQP